jgi:hypothetical protein
MFAAGGHVSEAGISYADSGDPGAIDGMGEPLASGPLGPALPTGSGVSPRASFLPLRACATEAGELMDPSPDFSRSREKSARSADIRRG